MARPKTKPSTMRRVPDSYYSMLDSWAKKMDVKNTDAFIIREKIISGNFQTKKKKKTPQGEIWEICLDNSNF